MGKISEAAAKAGAKIEAPIQVSFPDGSSQTYGTLDQAESATASCAVEYRRGGFYVTADAPTPTPKIKEDPAESSDD